MVFTFYQPKTIRRDAYLGEETGLQETDCKNVTWTEADFYNDLRLELIMAVKKSVCFSGL
jgi:hypothetical protein